MVSQLGQTAVLGSTAGPCCMRFCTGTVGVWLFTSPSPEQDQISPRCLAQQVIIDHLLLANNLHPSPSPASPAARLASLVPCDLAGRRTNGPPWPPISHICARQAVHGSRRRREDHPGEKISSRHPRDGIINHFNKAFCSPSPPSQLMQTLSCLVGSKR